MIDATGMCGLNGGGNVPKGPLDIGLSDLPALQAIGWPGRSLLLVWYPKPPGGKGIVKCSSRAVLHDDPLPQMILPGSVHLDQVIFPGPSMALGSVMKPELPVGHGSWEDLFAGIGRVRLTTIGQIDSSIRALLEEGMEDKPGIWVRRVR